MSKKKIVAIITCIVIIVLGLACGIICAYESNYFKKFVEIFAFIKDESYYSNLQVFLLMLFASVFDFIIAIGAIVLLIYICKIDLNDEEYLQRKALKREQDKQRKIENLQEQLDELKNN